MELFKKFVKRVWRLVLMINPGTPVDSVKHVLNLVDQVLVMTVNPGFGGQAFLPETMDKVRELAALREEKVSTLISKSMEELIVKYFPSQRSWGQCLW